MPPSTPRIESVDLLRGLTMLVMIFVNDAAGVPGLPWWNYHMPPGVNGMTYVDVVFPAFLFLVGMSIPLAIEKRLTLGDSTLQLWRHIFLRALGLVTIGYLIAHFHRVDPTLTGLPAGLWGSLGLLGAIAFWAVYPRDSKHPRLLAALKWAGLALLLLMFALFRRTTKTGDVAWLSFGYPEILGLIGRSYFAACLLYFPLRKRLWWPPTLLALLTAMNVAGKLGWLAFLKPIPYWLWPFDRGELPSIVVAGIVASMLCLDPRLAPAWSARLRRGAIYTALLAAAGLALLSFGVSKGKATPSWCLLSCAITMALFLALYWLVDVKGIRRWALPLKPAGSNTLLTYLLPDLFYFACGLSVTTTLFGPAWPGAAGALLFTAAMLAASAALTRLGLRLQL